MWTDRSKRIPYLRDYYAGSVYGVLHVWMAREIIENRYVDWYWWDLVNNYIISDMKQNKHDWLNMMLWIKTYNWANGNRYYKYISYGKPLWWTSHNLSMNTANRKYARWYTSMKNKSTYNTNLARALLAGANYWKVTELAFGLYPDTKPPTIVRLFLRLPSYLNWFKH